MKLRWFVTYWTHPRRLFLIHLEKRCSIKALQMGTRACSAWRAHSHLAKLQYVIATQLCDIGMLHETETSNRDQDEKTATDTNTSCSPDIVLKQRLQSQIYDNEC